LTRVLASVWRLIARRRLIGISADASQRVISTVTSVGTGIVISSVAFD
jgi:hypothetical protein